MSQSTWRLEEHRAFLESARLQLQVDVKHPETGLIATRFDGHPLDHLQCLQLDLPGIPAPQGGQPLVECYSRGPDLIATYTQSPDRTVRPQVYWRWQQQDDAEGLHLILSMQTSLLHSDPVMMVRHRLDAEQALQWTGPSDQRFVPIDLPAGGTRQVQRSEGAPLFLLRCRDSAVTVAAMIDPSDYQGAQWTVDDGLVLQLPLFREPLEKGVIRRARLGVAWMPRQNDQLQALSFFRHLIDAPPPLTT